MKSRNLILPISLMAGLVASCQPKAQETPEVILKDVFANDFRLGVAINVSQHSGRDAKGEAIILKHFNSIVPENCMKSAEIHPLENEYYWTDADSFVEFGEKHGLTVIGHCLIWHSQCSPWFCVDAQGNLVNADILKARMKDHISTIVGRYKGRVKGWDVVNEMIEDDGTFRQSQFYQILGEEFIPLALQYANEADPEAELYLNDYSMSTPAKRDAYCRLIRSIKERGIRIDAMGMQSHIGMDYPDFDEFEQTIDSLVAAGVKVQFTELDMTAIPNPFHNDGGAAVESHADYQASMNPYAEGLPDSVANVWNARMAQFMDIIMRHKNDVLRVCPWGVSDNDTWRNDWPINGRTDYPLWFDRDYQLKPFLQQMKSLNN